MVLCKQDPVQPASLPTTNGFLRMIYYYDVLLCLRNLFACMCDM